MQAKKILMAGSFFLILGVGLGAFGAHGLEKKVTEAAIKFYETGVRYHFYHAIGLMILGLIQLNLKDISLKLPALLMQLGIILFSFNCYLYAATDIKAFAMIVPIGGLSFIAAWALTLFKIKGYRF